MEEFKAGYIIPALLSDQIGERRAKSAIPAQEGSPNLNNLVWMRAFCWRNSWPEETV